MLALANAQTPTLSSTVKPVPPPMRTAVPKTFLQPARPTPVVAQDLQLQRSINTRDLVYAELRSAQTELAAATTDADKAKYQAQVTEFASQIRVQNQAILDREKALAPKKPVFGLPEGHSLPYQSMPEMPGAIGDFVFTKAGQKPVVVHIPVYKPQVQGQSIPSPAMVYCIVDTDQNGVDRAISFRINLRDINGNPITPNGVGNIHIAVPITTAPVTAPVASSK